MSSQSAKPQGQHQTITKTLETPLPFHNFQPGDGYAYRLSYIPLSPGQCRRNYVRDGAVFFAFGARSLPLCGAVLPSGDEYVSPDYFHEKTMLDPNTREGAMAYLAYCALAGTLPYSEWEGHAGGISEGLRTDWYPKLAADWQARVRGESDATWE